MPAVELSWWELITLRRALSRYRMEERSRMKRVRSGKIKRTSPAEQAMLIVEIETLRTKIHNLVLEHEPPEAKQ